MPTNVGPNTKGEESLVFGYDLGDPINSYKGAPVENYIHGQNAVAQDSYISYEGPGSNASWIANHPRAIRAYNASGGDITSYVNTGVGSWETTYHAHWQYDDELKKPVVVMNDIDGQWKAKSFGTGMGSWNSYGKGYGDTYTISWLQWVDNLSKNAKAGLYSKNTSGSNGFHDGQANSPSAYNTKTHTWQRVYQTYTTSSGRDLDSTSLSIYMYGHYDVRGTVKIADVQFNWGSYPAGFHDGPSRSATEGLLDLTGNQTISLANSSFDSAGQAAFDGSGDYFDLGSDQVIKTSGGWTVESIVKYDSVAGGYNNLTSPANFIGSDTISYNSWYWSVLNSKLALWNISPGVWKYGSTTIQPNTWYHVVLVGYGSGTKYQFYLNGVAEGGDHTTYSWNSAYSGLRVRYIGAGQSSRRYTNGTIPVTKIYNRELTAAEIAANFNAFKTRFNF